MQTAAPAGIDSAGGLVNVIAYESRKAVTCADNAGLCAAGTPMASKHSAGEERVPLQLLQTPNAAPKQPVRTPQTVSVGAYHYATVSQYA